MSHNNIYAITQDNQGFMWIGSQNGLDKYDGYKFLSYFHDPQDSSSLISANFGKLFTDSKGRIWIGTYTGGLSLYIPSNNEIHHFVSDANDKKGISNDLIRCIAEDKQGNIWIGTANGLNKFIEKDKTFKKYYSDDNDEFSLNTKGVADIAFDNKGNMWVATNKALHRFNLKTEKFYKYLVDKNDENSINSIQIKSLFIDKDDNVWIGTRNAGLNVYNQKTDKFTRYRNDPTNPKSIGDNRIQCIFQDSYGTMWIGTYKNGLSIFNTETKDFSHIRNSTENYKSLSSNTIEAIFEDDAANLWVGTRGGGINIFDLKPQKFYNIEKTRQNNTLPNPIVQAFYPENDSIIWIGTKGGLARLNTKNNKPKYFFSNNDENSISNDRIRVIIGDNDNNIWVGTYRGGLNKISKKNGNYEFTHFKADKNSINSITGNQINSLLIDKSDNLWIGSNGGVDKLTTDYNGNSYFENFIYSETDKNTISNRYVLYIYEDKDFNIWVCTSGGLDKYMPETNTFKRYANKTSGKNDIDANAFTNIFQDSDNNYWTGTSGGGLYQFDPEAGTFTPYSDGSSKTGSIMSIQEDNNNNLWISTLKGISKFCLKEHTFINYDITDGLSESGFSRNASCKTKDGTLYFGNISGYTIIKPNKIQANPHKPKVVLTDFKKFNKSIFNNRNSFSANTASYTTNLNLTYDDYVISFEFAALDFTNPGKNQYSYKLEGFNKEWIDFGNQRNIMFTNLQPGNYKLIIKATNNDGIWCSPEDVASIDIYVKPPFWRTWWFYSILGIITLLSIYLYTVIRTKQLKEKNEILEQKVKQRTIQLQESNKELEKLSVVARETNNSVTIMDGQGNFQWINEGFSKIFGYKNLDDFKAQMGGNILKGKFTIETVNAVKKVIQTKKALIIKTRIIDKYDKEKWLQTAWTPILDNNNEISQIISVDSDITEIINAENEIIKQRNILEQKNIEINRHNDDIKSSIRYAETIQKSILPLKKKFDRFSENFIVYLPKDIVSGDFYWYAETEEYHFAAVVDCTGHGVPGAFMSIISSRLFNKIVKDNNVLDPAKILVSLNEYVISTLNQNETGNRDGLDVGLIRVKKTNGTEKINEVLFCGAKQDMLYYNNEKKKIERIRGTRKAIGGVSSKRNKAKFENYKIDLNEGDSIYLLSDGYKDQNNPERERFGTNRLTILLEESINLPMDSQKDIIINILEKFKNGEKNRDDITILGLRF